MLFSISTLSVSTLAPALKDRTWTTKSFQSLHMGIGEHQMNDVIGHFFFLILLSPLTILNSNHMDHTGLCLPQPTPSPFIYSFLTFGVFDSGRFCVLNSGGKGLQAKGKRQSLIYTMMLATVRNVRCFAAVTIFARGCYRYTTFQSIVSQLHGLPGADAHVTTEWPLLLLCFSLLLKCKLFYTLEILHLRLQNITSL